MAVYTGVFVFHAYKRIVGAISKYKYYAVYLHLYTYYVYISAYWAPEKQRRLNEADRQSNHPESAAGTMGQRDHVRSPLSFRAFEERLARTTASAPKKRKKRPRLRISSNKQKQVREVSVRFMVIDGEPPKKIDIRQNACYSLSK